MNKRTTPNILGTIIRTKVLIPHDLSNQYANYFRPVASLPLKNSILWQGRTMPGSLSPSFVTKKGGKKRVFGLPGTLFV